MTRSEVIANLADRGAAAVHVYPAYDVVQLPKNLKGVIVLRDGDQLCLREDHMRHFAIGSVVSYALRNGDCPIKAVERARERRDETHYIFGLGSCITSHKQPREMYVQVSVDEIVQFEGRRFQIVNQPNRNLGLVEVQ